MFERLTGVSYLFQHISDDLWKHEAAIHIVQNGKTNRSSDREEEIFEEAKAVTKTAKLMILASAVASGCLFLGLLAGTGPAAEDAPMSLALDAMPLADLLLDPLPDPGEGATLKPLAALVWAVLFQIFPTEPWFARAALFLVHLSVLALGVRVLGRIVGWSAAGAGALLYAVHPMQAALFAAPASGMAALLPLLLVLVCMDRLAAYRERRRAGSFLLCLLTMGLAGVESGHVGIPLLVLAYDLSLAHGEYAQRLRHKVFLQIGLISFFGLTLCGRLMLSGAIQGLASGLQDTVMVLLAAPFDSAGPGSGPTGAGVDPAALCGWSHWSAWGFLVLCLSALLGRAVIDRRGFPRVFCKVFALLVIAILFQTEWAGSQLRVGVAFPLPLLFFAGVAGVLFAGPPAVEQKGMRVFLTITLGLGASVSMAMVAYPLCTEIADADRQAASAVDQIKKDLIEKHHTQLYLYNQPRVISLGQVPVATFLGNDLVVRLGPTLEELGITPYPFNGHGLLCDNIRILLATRNGAIPFEVDSRGEVSRITLTHEKIHNIFKTVRESGFDLPKDNHRLVLERNGFPLSLVPPPGTVTVRAVLLTPLGVCVAEEFETWMRFNSGRESFLFNNQWLRQRLRLFDGGRLIAWIELFDRSDELIQRTPSVLFQLRLGED